MNFTLSLSSQNNKAARNIKTLARTINDTHHSLLHTNANVARLTQQPQFALLRLQSEYESSEQMCRRRIGEVLQFSEHFLRSFVEVPRLDRFRDHLLPTAAESSSHILHGVVELVRSSGKPMPCLVGGSYADFYLPFQRTPL
jgi:hypothetical protein